MKDSVRIPVKAVMAHEELMLERVNFFLDQLEEQKEWYIAHEMWDEDKEREIIGKRNLVMEAKDWIERYERFLTIYGEDYYEHE